MQEVIEIGESAQEAISEMQMAMTSLTQTQEMANRLLNVSIALGVIAFLISAGCLIWLIKKGDN